MQILVLILLGVGCIVLSLWLATRAESRNQSGGAYRLSPARQAAPMGSAFGGEALFATGIDRCTVLLDCLMAPRRGTSIGHAVLQPVPIRVWHPQSAFTEQSLPATVKTWAARGQRVFVELSACNDGNHKAKLSCGKEALLVEIANDIDVRRSLTPRGPRPVKP